MKQAITYLILVLIFFAACTNKQQEQEIPLPLFPQPNSVSLNTNNGYNINLMSGDTIQPVILSNGDTLITGKPIPAVGKVIQPDSVAQLQVVPYIHSDSSFNAHPNVHKTPDNLTVIAVNKDSLIKILLTEISKNDTTHYLVNNTGDSVKTGVPIPTKGKAVAALLPKPTQALPPRFTDDANNKMQYLDVDQGMASSYLNCVYEDKRGNLWFGTQGGGVSMYNGEYFIHFTEKEGLSSNNVWSIIEDKSENLWFGTDGGGVSMYNGEYFTHFTEKEGLSSNSVLTVLEDKSGNLWFGTQGLGVCMYNGESFTHFTEKEGLSNNLVTSIMEDKSGNLWFGTFGGGVCMYNGESFTHFTEKDGLSNNFVFAIVEDKNGNLWFGTYGGGVSMYNGESFTYFTENEGLSSNFVSSILEDKSGNLWFGTAGGGVSKLVLSGVEGYNGESFTHFTEKEGLSQNSVKSIMEDKSGNLWFGTDGGGVSMYSGESFTHFTEKEGLSKNRVMSIIEDKSENLWFGTWSGGISMYNGESFAYLNEKENLSKSMVLSILEDKSGNFWFGSYGGGVSMYNGEYFTHFTNKEGLSHSHVSSIIEDKRGNIWFGTYGGGVSMYNGEYFTHFTEKEGLSSNTVWSIIEDKSGNLWFGTDGGGVSMYNGESFIHFTEKEGLSNNTVWSIIEDKSGNLWFGTDGGGVSMYNGESFIHFTEKEGLSNNTVLSIMEDKTGNLWLSTKYGLNELVLVGGADAVLAPKSTVNAKKQEYEIRTFGKQDGLRGLDFLRNSAFIDSKNRAWWGSGKNLTMLDLNKHKLAQNPPKLFLKQIDINEQIIDNRNLPDSLSNDITFNGVQRFENYPLNLELTHSKNHLTFHFVAIDWSAPHKIKYSYRLKGLDDNWSQPSMETKADYRNLPYGSFTFEVKTMGASQKWSESFEYTFTINPPWWHTWWARALYTLGGVLLIFGFVKWRTAKLIERQIELETEVKNATLEITEQKEEAEKQKEHIEEVHKEITDSINYAERIQRSFMATEELLNENLQEYFVYFQPKDVVSGDFYWAEKLSNGQFAMVNADSTGHGVPGAIMSILNISSVEKAIENGQTSPQDIFNSARKTIIERLKKDGSAEGGKDGMDASIICFDFKNNKFTYTAAQNPIWIIRNGELTEIKPEKMPIGKHDKDHIPFVGGEFEMQKGDQIYTLTDGFQDQFGGVKGKKFMVKKMREYVLSISNLSMQEQHQKIKEAFTNWKGELEQVDDVCVIGVKV